ncbi:MAG: hypothetical protein LH614_18660 [Pyrinomonadaceae bacterium]|nr:hypothetical protein [Pyrinomonadaceae bacterium]
MKSMAMKFYLTIFALLFFFATCTAQVKDNSEQQKSIRSIQTRPSAYITFERFVVVKPRYLSESENQILLRFHNNSVWNITVSVNGCRPEQEQCLAFYEVRRLPSYKDKIKESEMPSGYGAGLHVSSERTVKSGSSFLFTVSKESLAEGLYIGVEFGYDWEANSSIIHQATFYSSDLPKEEKK